MIRFAAPRADTVAFTPKSLPGGGLDPTEFSLDALDAKIAILERALATRIGDEPERAILAFEVHRTVEEIPEDGWTTRAIAAAGPYSLIGDTTQIVDTLIERRERWGITHWTCWEEDLEKFAPIVTQLAGT